VCDNLFFKYCLHLPLFSLIANFHFLRMKPYKYYPLFPVLFIRLNCFYDCFSTPLVFSLFISMMLYSSSFGRLVDTELSATLAIWLPLLEEVLGL
jgi:hypothetical protein